MVLAVWWRELGLRRALVAVVVTGLVACLTIAPWTIRNASVFHRFVPVSTNWSTTFWSGHNPAADGGPTYAPPSLLGPATAGKYGPDRELAESKVLGDAAKKWALHHPLQELALIPRKLLVLASGDSGAITLWLNGHGVLVLKGRTYTIFSALADLASYALVLLTLLAVAIRRRAVWTNGGTRGPLAFLALACVLYGVVYYGNFRYHIPLEPFMLLLAAPLVTETWERIRARRRRTVPGGVADGPPQALSHSA
jgi:hypothetical protein